MLCASVVFRYPLDSCAVVWVGVYPRGYVGFRGRRPKDSRFGFGRWLGRVDRSVKSTRSARYRRNLHRNRLRFGGVCVTLP